MLIAVLDFNLAVFYVANPFSRVPIECIYVLLFDVWAKHTQLCWGELLIELKYASAIFLVNGGISLSEGWLVDILLQLVADIELCSQSKDSIRKATDVFLFHVEVDRRFCYTFASKVCHLPAGIVFFDAAGRSLFVSYGKVFFDIAIGTVFSEAIFSIWIQCEDNIQTVICRLINLFCFDHISFPLLKFACKVIAKQAQNKILTVNSLNALEYDTL